MTPDFHQTETQEKLSHSPRSHSQEVAELRSEQLPLLVKPGSSSPGISPLNLRMKEACRPGANLERPGTPLALQVTRQEKDGPGQALIFLVRH